MTPLDIVLLAVIPVVICIVAATLVVLFIDDIN